MNGAWLFSKLSIGVSVLALAACQGSGKTTTGAGGSGAGGSGAGGSSGSSNSGGTSSGGSSGGSTTGGAAGSGATGGMAGAGGTGGMAGAGGTGGMTTTSTTTCKAPGTLHPPKAGAPSIFCPFSAPAGGKDIYCTAGTQHCCEPKMGTSTCDASGAACAAGDTDWQCQDPTDCGAGKQCCATGTFEQNADPNCANSAKGFTGTHCAATCAAGEITMCTSDGECGGKKCTPFDTHGAQVGACE